MVGKVDDTDFLRKLLEDILPTFKNGVFKVITDYHENLAQQHIGPLETRIGVFGPYPKGGKKTIKLVAKKIADLGLASITGMGYYLPNKSNELKDINLISPPNIRDVFKTEVTNRYQYYYLFPKIVSKAVFFMNDERGQTHELRGCNESSIPFIGFIKHKKITNGKLDCGYLVKKNGYMECTVPDIYLCSLWMPRRPFCPFYDSISISTLSLELFLKKTGKYRQNRLIAVRNYKNLEKMLNDCIQEHKQTDKSEKN